MIKVSEKAAEKFDEVKQKYKNIENAMIRISFGGFGWGGPRLQIALDELKRDGDVIVESQGVKVAYNSDLEPYVNGIVIDYSNKWYERGFILRGSGMSSC